MIEYILGAFIMCVFLGLLFATKQNSNTFQQREAIISAVSKHNRENIARDPAWYWTEGTLYWRDLEDVTYDRHFLLNLTFRNPMNEYSPRIQELMKNQ